MYAAAPAPYGMRTVSRIATERSRRAFPPNHRRPGRYAANASSSWDRAAPSKTPAHPRAPGTGISGGRTSAASGPGTAAPATPNARCGSSANQ